MASSPSDHWHPAAVYLYALHLDGPALAWEYLRRHPDYRLDWHRHRGQPRVSAQRWGLRLLEDPGRDARDALPDWLAGPAIAQIHPDVDPPPNAPQFELWTLPGHKELRQDGSRLRLTVRTAGREVRMALAPDLWEGMAYTSTAAVGRAGGSIRPRARVLADDLAFVVSPEASIPALACGRPGPGPLLEMHTLQALDGTLAGASLREVALVLHGGDVVAAGWHADGDLRAQVRRLVRRGQSLMQGGYLRLLQNKPFEQGRSASTPNVPAQNDLHS